MRLSTVDKFNSQLQPCWRGILNPGDDNGVEYYYIIIIINVNDTVK